MNRAVMAAKVRKNGFLAYSVYSLLFCLHEFLGGFRVGKLE